MPKLRMKAAALAGMIGGGMAITSLHAPEAFAAGPPTAAPAAVPGDGLSEPDGSLWTTSGEAPAIPGLRSAVVAWAPRLGGGAWEVTANGGVFARDGAPFYGSLGGRHVGSPVTSIAATANGAGYWLVTANGGVYAFGDAAFLGAAGRFAPASAVIGIASTPTGPGYWLVTAAGGVFTFGAARYHGSMAGTRLPTPVIGIVPTSTGGGYVMASRHGGVFAFGDATYSGSAAGALMTVGVSADRGGYDLVRVDGRVTRFVPGAAPSTVSFTVPTNEVAADEAALTPPPPPPAPVSHEATVRATVVAVARAELGRPYVYGAAGPAAFDCSGLTQFAYAQAGVSIPHNAAAQLASTPNIAASQLEPGDLVYFYPGITHVGIYIGSGEMIDAPHPGAVVRVDQIQYFGPLMGASDPAA
jgi:cell wall-associated NlpC family hydrolase